LKSKHERLRLWNPLASAVLVSVLGACASNPPEEPPEEAEPFTPVRVDEPEPIGRYLAELDKSVRAWTTLVLTARTEIDRSKAKALERELMARTLKRKDEIVAQLEGGSTQNRVRAAGALGFTRQPEAQSPLLAALFDDSPDVVCNALLGLTLLQLPDTPLEEIARLFQEDPDPQIRANAGYAIRSTLEAGGEAIPAAVQGAQLGLIDAEPLVRVHSALILGLAKDTDSIPALQDLLADDLPLVAHSATKGLVLIGKNEDTARGKVARILVQAMMEKREDRQRFQRALVELSGKNLGEDPEAWHEWAQRLP
jgi:HEAT repeat protein